MFKSKDDRHHHDHHHNDTTTTTTMTRHDHDHDHDTITARPSTTHMLSGGSAQNCGNDDTQNRITLARTSSVMITKNTIAGMELCGLDVKFLQASK